jgi:hypothetical protein
VAITSQDTFLAAAKQFASFYKASATAKGAGSFHSLWLSAGVPGAGAAAGSAAGAACDRATAGALPLAAMGASNNGYLVGWDAAGATVGALVIFDRLVHTSALSGTVTTAQTVNSAALTRWTDGLGVEAWLEFYSATGATAATATVSYTNSDGTAGRSGTAAVVATTVAGQLIPITLQAGDKGVRSVQSVTLSVSTGTAGNFGVTLMKRLGLIPNSAANIGGAQDLGDLGLAAIKSAAETSTPCLAFSVVCSCTATGIYSGTVRTAEG